MSLAENLLNTLNSDNAIDSQDTNDIEEPIIVDETRKIIVPDKLKMIAVTGDKDVETVTFNCIRYWDAVHDLSNFVIYINYILPNNETGTYIPTIKERYEDYFTFDWVIGREITKYKGTLTFLILARKVDSNGILDYQWSSLANSECTIAQGIDVINVTDDKEAEDRLTLLLQLPLEKGISDNSIQQESCVAGLKGFYWSVIDTINRSEIDGDFSSTLNVIKLSTKNGNFGTEQDFNIQNFWDIGDVISIHSDKKYTNCAKIVEFIEEVNEDFPNEFWRDVTIVVDSFPFETATEEAGHITDQAVYVLAKPDKGLVDFGQGSVAVGTNCKAVNYAAFTAGYGNQSIGQYGAVTGRENTSGYACLVGGRQNTVTGNCGVAGGQNNALSGTHGAIFGKDNEITADLCLATGAQNKITDMYSGTCGYRNNISAKYCYGAGFGNTITRDFSAVFGENNTAQHIRTFVAGIGHYTKTNSQAIFGQYSNPINALFVVGNGTSDSARSNAFEVFGDGTATVGGKTIATEGFVDESLEIDETALNLMLEEVLV